MGVFFGLFAFSGSATRLMAWTVLLVYFVLLVAWAVLAPIAPVQSRFLAPPLQLASWAMLATSVRRLHHAGWSGSPAVLTLVPFAGVVVAAVIALLPQRRPYLRANNPLRALGYGAMIALLLVACLRLWWVPYWVPSESMKPTLLEGDYLLVRYGQPKQRGDAIVFIHPVTGDAHVKRVLGVAGDSVALQSGKVLVNDAALAQLPMGDFAEVMGPKGPEQLRPRCSDGLVGDGAICRKEISAEVVPGAGSYLVANIQNGLAGDDFGPVTVPPDTLFLLGDNRDNSLDSRFAQNVGGLGFVPIKNHIGHIRRVLFSAEGAGFLAVWAWRAGRFWAKVQ